MLYDFINGAIEWASKRNPVVLLVILLAYLAIAINLVEWML